MNTSNEPGAAGAATSSTLGNLTGQAPPMPTLCDQLFEDVMRDIRDMLDYIRAEGKTIPEDLRTKISKLICETDEVTLEGQGGAPKINSGGVANENKHDLSLTFEVHGKLSQIVEPANPRTIRASRLTGKYKFFADNTTVKLLLWASILSLAVFIGVVILQAATEWRAEVWGQGASTNAVPAVSYTMHEHITSSVTVSNDAAGVKTADTSKTIEHGGMDWSLKKAGLDILIILAAASLGSAFYGLYTAHKYLVKCTFDPKYHQVYLIRYVLGLTSGTILGFMGRDSSFFSLQGSKQQIGTAVLALVGGYAAEAVSQILQRFAETLVTTVRGNNNDALQAKEAELKVKAKQQELQTKNEIAKKLSQAKDTVLAAHGTGSPATAEIQKVIDSLSA